MFLHDVFRLSNLMQGFSLLDTAQMLRALIGGFDLDPNRVLDLVLVFLEIHSSGPSTLINAYLYLAQQLCLQASLTHILGFKFQHFRSYKAPKSLCHLVSTLVGAGAISLEPLMPHFLFSPQTLADHTRSLAKEICETARAMGFVSLSASAVNESHKPKLTGCVSRAPDNGGHTASPPQMFDVLEAFLWDRRWYIAQPVLICLERVGTIPVCNTACRQALISLAHCVIDSIYITLSPRLLGLAALPKQDEYRSRKSMSDPTSSQLDVVLEPLCCHLYIYMAFDASLMCKLARVVKYLLKSKTRQVDTDVAKRILEHILLPAISILPVNPGCVFELWSAAKLLSCRERHLFYSTWCGRGVERGGIGSKNFQVTLSECNAGCDARKVLKRVANEKKNFKHVGRALAKIAHSNPFVVFRTILAQIESYDNMIVPIVESLGFMNPLAFDVLSYMLHQHLADKSRHKLQNDGINIAHWFQHLAQFAGVFYRTYPQVELKCLVDFLLGRLEIGESLELLVFSELLSRMGGCGVLEDISETQIGGLAGGEVLRHGVLAFEKASKKAVLRLQRALCTTETAIPLLALIAQQRGFALYRGQLNHVKLIGQLFDRCQAVLVQLVDFLSGCKEHAEIISLGNMTASYLALLPNLQTLFAMRFEPQIAFHASRPLIAEAISNKLHRVRQNSGVQTPQNLHAWDPDSPEMKAAVFTLLPSHERQAITSELYRTFWSLSLHDIYVPENVYKAHIAFLQSRDGVILREGGECDKRKKESARMLLVVDTLTDELDMQRNHCKGILGDMNKKRNSLLDAIVEDQRRSISEAILKLCIMPRMTITPEDSLFCANFFHKMHMLEPPNFSSLQFYDRVVKDIFPLVYCATDHEARCLGIFLRALFEPLKRWRLDKSQYEKEAASKLGFSVAIGSPARCSYDQYCTVFSKWHDKITKIIIHCLDKYGNHGRACLLVLIKLVGVYPARKRTSITLMEKLDPLKQQEKYKDVQAMAYRYYTLLDKHNFSLEEDFSRSVQTSSCKRQMTATKSR
mmetsp:Transcript_11409/g.35136  ORF Transcript_11409/g.35136 Transcript_11409/m.35136 type:complete len:1030 (+) Transcript_11409:550-3639(+)